jgi:DNA-binding transcriptional LysR family regulator
MRVTGNYGGGMDLDARCYRCFIGVAELRSFTRAATKLNLSQPALSGQIHDLERRLSFELFKRTSQSVELTGEGSLLLPYAKHIVCETELINRAARDIKSNALRLGAALRKGV